jgi:hypothetical protein
MFTTGPRLARVPGKITVVDETDHAIGAEWIAILVRVDREIWQRISANCLQEPA